MPLHNWALTIGQLELHFEGSYAKIVLTIERKWRSIRVYPIVPNKAVWYLKIGFMVDGARCFMNCTLINVFGRFDKKFNPINIELTKAETKFVGAGVLKNVNRFTFERKHDGSEVLIHIYIKLDGGNTIEFPEPMTLWEVWKLELSGCGELSDERVLGSGINATLIKWKGSNELNFFKDKKIPRIENRFRVAKVNQSFKYDPQPAKPPECITNTCYSTFDLVLVDEKDNFEPFALDRNIYAQSNWYGEGQTTKSIVRMLYDGSGTIRELAVSLEKHRLNAMSSSFSGAGKGTQGPIEYFYNGHTCVVNGYMPGWYEEYSGIQKVDVRFKVKERASVLIDGERIESLCLEGTTSQNVNTVIGSNTVNTANVSVKLNGNVLRNITRPPIELATTLLKDPFSGKYQLDNHLGVYAKFHFGLLTNNLLGLFTTRLTSSDLNRTKACESNSVLGIDVSDKTTLTDPSEFYTHGAFNRAKKSLIRNKDGRMFWL